MRFGKKRRVGMGRHKQRKGASVKARTVDEAVAEFARQYRPSQASSTAISAVGSNRPGEPVFGQPSVGSMGRKVRRRRNQRGFS